MLALWPWPNTVALVLVWRVNMPALLQSQVIIDSNGRFPSLIFREVGQ